MKRMMVVFALAFAVLGSSSLAQAQKPGRIFRIGYLSSAKTGAYRSHLASFRRGIEDLGYREGKDVIIEERYAAGQYGKLPQLAADLVRRKVDIFVTHGGTATRAAEKAGKRIPIVFAVMSDPVGRKIIKSLAHPGGNITGLASHSRELLAKRLEILKEVVPSASRVVLLYKSGRRGKDRMNRLRAAALGLGVKIVSAAVDGPGDFGRVFGAIRKERAEGLLVQGSGLMAGHHRQITAFALKSRLPSIYGLVKYAEAGGFLAYGPDFHDMYRRAATFVDKILKGVNPADLPVEQPTKFNLTVNLKTAKALGITIPPEVLFRATKVIR